MQSLLPRVVADANVLVSATLVEGGPSARILDAARKRHIVLVVSTFLLDEYHRVIRRPHIARKYKEVGERSGAILSFLRRFAILVEGQPVVRVIPDDPKDDAILACAVEGRARDIVSGDHHLLELEQYRGIRILSPRDFVSQILKR